MSHFVTAVFSRTRDEVESLLAPYNECDEAYYEFEEVNLSELESCYHRYLQQNPDSMLTFEQYVEDLGYTMHDGVAGYMTNPNARWDWWQIGGRWAGELNLKPDFADYCEHDTGEMNSNQAKAVAVDFSGSPAQHAEAEKFWDNYVEGKNPEAEWDYWSPEYYKERYGTKENYASHCARFSVHAFVTPDGDWYEQGQMGWFAVDDATPASIREFDDNLKLMIERAIAEDLWITVVDCHI